ncbi:MAG: class I SAM-dependent methyltransferase [Nitrospirae bacterium]|nr:class I SAM-dependent methyltransferase [Nitrospirota bacterium]MBI5694786.1 class I SAM-dependent methyltransferase [Nitrospirota bacterium]
MGTTAYDTFEKMLKRRHWLYRPWIPYLKAIEGEGFLTLDIKRPVLDLACGDGVFTQSVFGAQFEAGFDLYEPDLRKAKANGSHKSLTRASAYEAPYKTGSFGTVISVCAIEHMPEIDRVLGEVGRVLAPGGRFIFTVPSVYFGGGLLTPAIYKMFGLNSMAARYADRKNARSQHYHVLPVAEWERRIGLAGMDIKSHMYVIDERELLLWSFMASSFFKPLTYPFRWLKSEALDRLFERFLLGTFGGVLARSVPGTSSTGGYLLVEAVRRGA